MGPIINDCKNVDTIKDKKGNTCSSFYDEYSSECGNYDSDEFIASDICCACSEDLGTEERKESKSGKDGAEVIEAKVESGGES